jgi:hypothetical protein
LIKEAHAGLKIHCNPQLALSMQNLQWAFSTSERAHMFLLHI